jgi:hypothetical protein
MLDKARRKPKKGGRMASYLAGLTGLACTVWALTGLWGQWVFGPPTEIRMDSFYPLEVGRYWVYTYQKPGENQKTLVERRIESHARQGDRELFFLNDGSLLYNQDGKVFEMGQGGSLNVVPLSSLTPDRPFIYRSQGLHIEKRIGAVDTVLVVNGRRYEECMEVITAFRSVASSAEKIFTYASYYARGIGLVGRADPDATGEGVLSVVLEDYGTRPL